MTRPGAKRFSRSLHTLALLVLAAMLSGGCAFLDGLERHGVVEESFNDPEAVYVGTDGSVAVRTRAKYFGKKQLPGRMRVLLLDSHAVRSSSRLRLREGLWEGLRDRRRR